MRRKGGRWEVRKGGMAGREVRKGRKEGRKEGSKRRKKRRMEGRKKG